MKTTDADWAKVATHDDVLGTRDDVLSLRGDLKRFAIKIAILSAASCVAIICAALFAAGWRFP